MTSSASKTATAATDGALVFLGLGANVGSVDRTLAAAVDHVREHVAVDAVSSIYESAPYGMTDQPRFRNLALRGRTTLEPAELLAVLKDTERTLGRTPGVRMGPREIDIDILMYGGLVLEEPGLIIPHADLLNRSFVLRPLLDIDPELRHPLSGELLRDALARLGDAGELVRIEPPPRTTE